MKMRTSWMIVPGVLAVVLATTGSVLSETISVNPGLKPDPQILQGTSGGSKSSDCGFIADKPNQTIKVTAAVPYMRFDVESSGSPTLLVDGPNGRFCVLADGSGKGPQMSGFWAPGDYSVFIGDRAQGKHPYKLSISQTPQ